MNIFSFFTIFLLGLCLGSFLNAWVCRTRTGESIARGRSKCPHCSVPLAFQDLIPLLSFCLLKGKCRKCQKKISFQYPLVELTTGFLFVGVAFFYFFSGSGVLHELFFRDLFVVFFLEFVFLYDFLYGEIPWKTTFFPGIVLFVASLVFGWNSFFSMLVGIFVGAGFFLFQYSISKGTWVGGGDIGMGFLMGVVLGWPFILLGFFLAYVGGTMVLLPFLFFKKLNRKSAIPFGTFLSIATFFVMMWGEKMLSFFW